MTRDIINAAGTSIAGVSVWQAQYAYFIYRSIDSFSHLVVGSNRLPAEFDAISQLYARVINASIKEKEFFPAFDEVLEVTEALSALLFCSSLHNRGEFWSLFLLSYDICFGSRRRDGSIGGDSRLEPLFLSFERALADYRESWSAEQGAMSLSHSAIQIREMAHLLALEAQATGA